MNTPKERIYISGPISGLPENEVRLAFSETMRLLRMLFPTSEIVNPLDNGLPYEAPWEEHIEADLLTMQECEAVYFMDGWENSLGCQVEHAKAVELLMDRYYQSPIKQRVQYREETIVCHER